MVSPALRSESDYWPVAGRPGRDYWPGSESESESDGLQGSPAPSLRPWLGLLASVGPRRFGLLASLGRP